MSVFTMICYLIKAIFLSVYLNREPWELLKHHERKPYFYSNLVHRNLISLKRKRKHKNVGSCMQLTADPQGIAFMNKKCGG